MAQVLLDRPEGTYTLNQFIADCKAVFSDQQGAAQFFVLVPGVNPNESVLYKVTDIDFLVESQQYVIHVDAWADSTSVDAAVTEDIALNSFYVAP